MCKVVVNDANKNVEFIIYNHLFSKEKYEFTISELVEDLHQYVTISRNRIGFIPRTM